jgi:hypothetical protein
MPLTVLSEPDNAGVENHLLFDVCFQAVVIHGLLILT